jgi:hypothetical protein
MEKDRSFMSATNLRTLLEQLKAGGLSVGEALEAIRQMSFEDLGFAKVDHHRTVRCGFPEVIFCQGKTPEQVRTIADRLLEAGGPVLATRADSQVAQVLKEFNPGAVYHEAARAVVIEPEPRCARLGLVAVLSAGTADIPVAEEARVTADLMGAETRPLYDVGVAGLHRLLRYQQELQTANVVVVVAGMEGALASVVGGLVEAPVIAVPTSIGYGASFQGLAPLLTMLNSCAAGVAVVNIDNGFGAGYLAGLINRAIVSGPKGPRP